MVYSANLILLGKKLPDGLDSPHIPLPSPCTCTQHTESTYNQQHYCAAMIPQYIYLPIHIESV